MRLAVGQHAHDDGVDARLQVDRIAAAPWSAFGLGRELRLLGELGRGRVALDHFLDVQVLQGQEFADEAEQRLGVDLEADFEFDRHHRPRLYLAMATTWRMALGLRPSLGTMTFSCSTTPSL